MKLPNVLALVLATFVHLTHVNHVVVAVRRKNRHDVDVSTDVVLPTVDFLTMLPTAATVISSVTDKTHNHANSC